MKYKNCFERNGTIYYRKKLPVNLGKNTIYKVSLKRLLGSKLYYELLSKSNIYSFIDYINEKLEEFLISKDILNLEDINKFIQNLLKKYRSKATIVETADTDFLDNFGSTNSLIEDKRFKALSYYEDNGTYIQGHTLPALEKEKHILIEAYDSGKMSLLSEAAKKVIARQDVILEDEIEEIPENLLKKFFEALVKVELNVIEQDIKNYTYNTTFIQQPTFTQAPSASQVLEVYETEIMKQVENDDLTDNWDFLIEEYLVSKIDEGNQGSYGRKIKSDLNQFKEIMEGSVDYGIPKRLIRDVSVKDIVAIKKLISYLPNLTHKSIKDLKHKGTLFLINLTKNELKKSEAENREPKIETLALKGMISKTKAMKLFIQHIKIVHKPYAESVNMGIWDKLLITEKGLDLKLKKEIMKKEEIALSSNYLSEFLLQKYDQKLSQKKKNFKVHTGNSPHLFWSFVLAIYTGARSEELAQLMLKDFYRTKIDGKYIYYINIRITDLESQSLKTKNAKRTVPLHDNIIKLGFFNYLSKRFESGSDWLFSLTLNKDRKRRDFARNWNYEFPVWFKESYPDIIGTTPSFHDLRSHFIGKYFQTTEDEKPLEKISYISKVNIKKIVGHHSKLLKDDVTVDSYYKEGLEIKAAYNLIMNIDFKIDKGFEYIKNLTDERFDPVIKDLRLLNKTIVVE